MLDTRSADFWVFSSQLPAEAVVGHRVYNLTRSPSFRTIPGATFEINYFDGTHASGNVGSDTVDAEGATVIQQAVQLATTLSSNLTKDTATNGILCLGFSEASSVKPTKPKTFFENIMPTFTEPLFTADPDNDIVGVYEFGRIDSTKFTGSLSWIPINKASGHWHFTTAGFAVDKGMKEWKKVAAVQAVADTGTTLMLVSKPQGSSTGILEPGSRRSNHRRRNRFSMQHPSPRPAYRCGRRLHSKSPRTGYQYGKVHRGLYVSSRNSSPSHSRSKLTKVTTVCYGGIQGTTSGLLVWGDVFFRSQFVVFHGNHSLGVAPKH